MIMNLDLVFHYAMANFYLQVRKPLDSYTRVLTVFIDHSQFTLREVSRNNGFYDAETSCSGEHLKGYSHFILSDQITRKSSTKT